MENQGIRARTWRSVRANIVDPFSLLWKGGLPMAGIFLPFFLEGVVYFGTLTVLTKFLAENVGLGDIVAGWMVGGATAGITLTQFALGEVADRKGFRWGLLFAFSMMLIGRSCLGLGEVAHLPNGLWSPLFFAAAIGLLFVAIGYGTYQPAAYSGVKKLARNTRDMALASGLLYALQNLGAFASGKLSAWLRKLSEVIIPPNGISGVLIVYIAITALSLLATSWMINRRAVAKAKKKQGQPPKNAAPKARILSREWFHNHPLWDRRFVFFIFVLMPVQTLFAHNWLTMPLYIERSFPTEAAAEFEFYSNINPLIIFVTAPLVAALTARANVYTMMIVGTTIMASPTIMLALWEPNPGIFIAYILIESVGEAMWQPRFLQYAVEIAPEGKEGVYMGVAQFPWFLTKLVTSAYSGWFLAHYCPPERHLQNTQFMWAIYTVIACVTPVALFLARGWVGANIANRTGAANESAPRLRTKSHQKRLDRARRMREARL